ncbi:hypothetical protein CTAYLR_003744 [Chrysophaeum taylorii]|uniref:Vacuolar protein sorting-associated protein 29 n=1 Tax=Chrysophaeum taylorii TaxID=2483200 RepID=A0AAD7UED3_9STRA|nr:hypothetical protein CTAYLR_003744 [Chrysophaeum taylorii]
MLVPNKMQHVICTGNSKDQYEGLRTLAPNVHMVSGDLDEGSFPESKVVQIGQFRIGVMHGHQIAPWGDPHSLGMFQRRLDVDILITGHTHKNEYYGAYSSLHADVTPSFILLAIQGNKVVTYVYQLLGDTVDVSKSEFQ